MNLIHLIGKLFQEIMKENNLNGLWVPKLPFLIHFKLNSKPMMSLLLKKTHLKANRTSL